MMFELAMHVRLGIKVDRDPDVDTAFARRALKCGQISTMAIIMAVLLSYITFCAYMCWHLDKLNRLLLFNSIGYSFLATFVLMASVNVFLIQQIRAKNRALGQTTNLFRKEECRLFLIVFCFELSFALRFIWDAFLEEAMIDLYFSR